MTKKKTTDEEHLHLRDLLPDPKNAREHNPRNIGMVVDSLHEVGAARSIVIDEANVVLAGNGVIEAAGEAGITGVRVIDADGDEIIAVRRSNLTPEQKQRLALYDNRTAELATWNADVLRALAGDKITRALFSDEELVALVGAMSPPEGDDNTPGENAVVLDSRWMIVVACDSEAHQRDLLERFTAEGMSCRAVSS